MDLQLIQSDLILEKMIKVKNLQNIVDNESITKETINDLMPDKHIPGRKKNKPSLKEQRYMMEKWDDVEEIEANGGMSINSQCGLVPKTYRMKKKASENEGPFTEYMQNYKQKKRQNPAMLKQIITEQKIKIIVRNFVSKLMRNNTNSKPIQYTPFQEDIEMNFLQKQGLELHDYVNIAITMLSAVLIVALFIIYTMSIVFDQVNQSSVAQAFQSFSFVFYVLEIGLNLITVKFEDGKKLSTIKDIWSFYLQDSFAIDLISVIILFMDLFLKYEFTIYLRLFIFVKLSRGLEKVQKMEVFYIHNFYKEQYWSLIKVFLFNFSFAHILAIFLIAMANLDKTNNWMTANKDIYLAPWYEKYVWSYYWSSTIMLTVGFGDLTATTYQQALVITFIEMISCICLAYNINCVGILINNIRSQDIQKSKNFKIFRKLSKKNDVSQDLQWRINNYIEQSSNIKKKFNYEQQNHFVQKLPKGLRTQFLKQSNKKIFQDLPFFKNLMQRTLFSFAEKIEMHICHPQQIIQHIDDPHNLLILKGGQLGFTCKKAGCDYNSTVIDQLRVKKQGDPVLVSLGFIRHFTPLYEIKSLEYSILYFLNHEDILSILKNSEMDYELYCLLRDKGSNMPDQFQLFNCQICKGRHTKFTCPKLHFIPIRQHVTNKYTYKFRTFKNQRIRNFKRFQGKRYSALVIYLDVNHDQEKQCTLLKNTHKQQQIKNSNNLLGQRKMFEEIQQTSNNIFKELSEIKDFFSKNTAQLIKHQMSKALFIQQGADQVWLVESDKMKNYKHYFELDNSCNLVDKFNPQRRMGTQSYEEVEDFWTEIRSNGFLQGMESKAYLELKDRSDKSLKSKSRSKMTLRTSLKSLKTISSRKAKEFQSRNSFKKTEHEKSTK